LNVTIRRRLHLGLAGAVAAVTAAGLVITAQVSTAGAAERPTADANKFRAGSASDAVPDSYIVVFRDGAPNSVTASAVGATSRELAADHQAKVTHEYTSVLRGFAATMSEQDARELAADSRVAFVEQNATVTIADDQTGAPWGLDRSDQANLPLNGTYSYASKAENVNAYVIDTGISTQHGDFGGRASVGTDTVDDGRDGEDCNGHGTHVAGTVGGATYGLAKGVKLFAVRVLDCAGSGTNAGVIAGVDWVTANAQKPAVANMSLGGGASTALDNAVRTSIRSGVVYSLAAGNENADACGSSPARTPEAITVGATTRTDARASFSNTGTCVDLFAPGQDIASAWIGGTGATRTISGTSMAAPHVAGAIALYLAKEADASPAEVQSALTGCATEGVVGDAGSGSPNRLLLSTC
jgi:subtilisin family serine protease